MKTSRIHKPKDIGLEEWQRTLRKEFAEKQSFKLKNRGEHPILSDFSVSNPESGKTYKVAIRGESAGVNYCSCPDFSINNIGTCKHIEFTLFCLRKKRGAKKAFKEGFDRPYSEVYLTYGLKKEVRFKAGKDAQDGLLSLVGNYFDSNGTLKDDKKLKFHEFLSQASKADDYNLRCYDDVLDYISDRQDEAHRQKIIREKLKEGIRSPILKNILKTKLYDYQLEGALFAVKAGRCLIGDDMGLGKTVQALAATKLLEKLFHIEKVLIVTPTSLKHQWKMEIEKFHGNSSEVVEGPTHIRREIFKKDSFFKLINYELAYRHMDDIKEWSPDLIVLDEAQRIKNWRTRTAQYIKRLESDFAIVLTGTPIENKIEELHSIMEFIDRKHLGPLYRFVHNHRVLDDGGKVVGYQKLNSVRESLKNVMIRRKKDEVLKQLPGRIDKNFHVPMTEEQREIHDENMDIVAKLAAKWRRYKFLCEADQRRLLIALNYMRMAADNTYLVDHKTVHGPKVEELEIILKELILENGEKAVIFSQWLRMTELVGKVLERLEIKYVHLNGSIPSKQRKKIIADFKNDAACKVFLSTDAGGVGLNLQSGSVVINMDIPWNPAILEQRIGRVHRIGQSRVVRVINFVSSGSIEERILGLLKFKKSLFAGALDEGGDDVVMIGESQLKRFMKTVEEATEKLQKSGPELEREKVSLSSAKPSESPQGKPAPARTSGPAAEPLGQLLQLGANFLMDVSKGLARQPGTGGASALEKQAENLIGKDEKTGETFIKLPVPEPETMRNLVNALGNIMSAFKRI